MQYNIKFVDKEDIHKLNDPSKNGDGWAYIIAPTHAGNFYASSNTEINYHLIIARLLSKAFNRTKNTRDVAKICPKF